MKNSGDGEDYIIAKRQFKKVLGMRTFLFEDTNLLLKLKELWH